MTVEAPAAPTRRQIATVVAGILMTVILAALDQSVVTTALPAIARELHGLEHLSWIVSAYLLTSTTVTLVFGKLSDIYGRRGLLLFAVVVFVGASLLCALAQNVTELIAARALQGAGAGGMIVTAQATMADSVAPRERARYAVFVTTTFALASAAGPPLGGFFVDHLTWRWVFWVNLPFGILAFLICRRFPSMHRGDRSRRIDVIGLGLLSAAVTLLLLIASWGGTVYAWLSPPILAPAAACAALFAAFAARELRAADPIFPPRLFANSIVRIGDATIFLVGMLMFAAIVLVPVFLQLVSEFGAGSSGALLVPMLLGMAIASTFASQFMRRTGRYKRLLPASLGTITIAYLLLATMTAATPPQLVASLLLLLGLGLGAGVPTINVAVQNAADPRDLGVAISTVTFSRSLGGAFGAAIFWSLLLGFLGQGLSESGLAAARSILFQSERGATALSPSEHAGLVAALAHAFHNVFLIGAAVAAVALVVALRLREEPLKTTRPSERLAT